MYKKIIYLFALTAALYSIYSFIARQDTSVQEHPNIIFVVADGFGPAATTMGRYFKGQNLTLDKYFVGTVKTYSFDNLITDSAASATAYSIGKKTYNGAIGIDADGKAHTTLLEFAKDQGYSTGLVTTSEITDATPASFSAHVKQRKERDKIALQQMNQNIDLMLGGGKQHFLPLSEGGQRTDGRNLLQEASNRNVNILNSKQDLLSADALPAIGLFVNEDIPFALDQIQDVPNLLDMTQKALELLDRSQKPYFLLLESGNIDTAAHENDIAAQAAEVIMYDKVVQYLETYVQSHPNTIIVLTADHETGGLALGVDGAKQKSSSWQPETVKTIQHSHFYFYEQLKRGESLEVILQEAGLNEVIPQERATLEKLYHTQDFKALVRYIIVLNNERTSTGWSTRGHTSVDVNLYVMGAPKCAFIGNYNNIEIYDKLHYFLNF